MNRRTLLGLLGACVVPSAGIAMSAQTKSVQSPVVITPDLRPGAHYGPLINGTDIGFQRVTTSFPVPPGQVVGKLMVRVNGEWLEMYSGVSGHPA
jgi:hypothetical protein